MNRVFKICTVIFLTILMAVTSAFAAMALESDEFSPDNNDINISKFMLTQKKFKNYEMLGVQLKNNSLNSARFISVALSEVLSKADDYGYEFNVVEKTQYTSDIRENTKNYIKGNSTVISCKDTENSIAFGKYGNKDFSITQQGFTRYKYITAAVNNIPNNKYVVARFYVKTDGEKVYADYKKTGAYCVYDTENIVKTIKSNIEIIAHRGAEDVAPENTIAAFEEAGKRGYDGVEADFWITYSGDLLVLHNEKINGVNIRNISVDNRINYPIPNDYASIELEAEYRQQYIPTVEEVVKTVSKYKIKLFLHTKDDATSAENFKTIANILDKYNMRDKTVIYSKDMSCCKRIQSQGLTPGYIISDPSYLTAENAINLCVKNNVGYFIMNYIDGFPSEKNIIALHQGGVKLGIYSGPTLNANGTLFDTMKIINKGIDFTIVNNYI